MWRFEAEQRVFDVGGVKIGGYPGRRPTVLIGSIFYRGHRIIEDPKAGRFDRERAEALIRLQEEYSDRTGLPHVIDVVGSNEEDIKRYLEFVIDASDSLISIDGTVAGVRMAGLEYLMEQGVKRPFIYNSLTPEAKREELEKLKEAGVKCAILLTYNRRDMAFTTEGRIEAARGLIGMASRAGVEAMLIDTVVLDIPTLGLALKAIHRIKDELGMPSGCGAHNAVGTWRGLRRKMGSEAVMPVNVSTSVLAAACGADFVLYGPIDHAKMVFPSIAMVDAAFSQVSIEEGFKIDRSHPRFRIA